MSRTTEKVTKKDTTIMRITPQRGFTIVELLIVIVVIGILAAITIIAYNGISAKATAASVQTDVSNVASVLRTDYVSTSTYPASLGVANNGQGIRIGSTYFQYTVDNSTSPATFCLTGVSNNTAYYITQDSAPMAGLCPGHTLTGGNPIINLAKNPSCEGSVGMTGWNAASGGSYGTGTLSLLTTGGYAGTNACRETWSGASSSVIGGPNVSSAYRSSVVGGQTYTISGYVRANKVQRLGVLVRWLDASNNPIGGDIMGPGTVASVNTWTQVSYTLVAPANAVVLGYFISSAAGTSGTVWAAGDTLDVDAVMVTAGSTVYNYADGNSPGWSWSGTINGSTSTGPPQ